MPRASGDSAREHGGELRNHEAGMRATCSSGIGRIRGDIVGMLSRRECGDATERTDDVGERVGDAVCLGSQGT